MKYPKKIQSPLTLFLFYCPHPTSSGIQTSCCLDCLAALVPEFTINHSMMQIAKLGELPQKLSRIGILSQTEGGWVSGLLQSKKNSTIFTISQNWSWISPIPSLLVKKAHTNYMFANCWPVSPFSRISWHRPTMDSAVASCCSFSKTGMEENKKKLEWKKIKKQLLGWCHSWLCNFFYFDNITLSVTVCI